MSIPAALREGELRPSAATATGAITRAPVAQRQHDAFVGELETDDVGLYSRLCAQCLGENLRKMSVLDVPAEHVARDFARAKFDGAGREQGTCVVDEAQHAHGRA